MKYFPGIIYLAAGLTAGLLPAPDLRGEPPLPSGLGSGPGEPALPSGLGGEPDLPSGLAARDEPAPPPAPEPEPFTLPFRLSGFAEGLIGARTRRDPDQKDLSAGEVRLQLEGEKGWDRAALRVRADFIYDPVLDRHSIDLESGQGWLDLREARLSATPISFLDLKAGRQILTWGTGDLLFINDLFPKDWNSFFIGRDDEYLKAPADSAVVSLFTGPVNLDLVYSPRFDPDRYIDGRRISYYNPALGGLAGRDAVVEADVPDRWFKDDEAAFRLYRNISGWEAALYGYRGYWKSPAGSDPVSGKATFPRLGVYGGSLRGVAAGGIGNLEFGFYDSEENRSGADPLAPNSELRFLAGYERELFPEFNVGVQYYLEYMLGYDNYRENLPPGQPRQDEARHVLSLRLTRLLFRQNLILSFFGYWSPSDRDFYLRPRFSYKLDDHWTAALGANVFWGADDWTFFGQFRKNTNVYLSLRYGF